MPIAGAGPDWLSREELLRRFVVELTDTLEHHVGPDESRSVLSAVGRRLAEQIHEGYRPALGEVAQEEIGEVLVDITARIGGRFSVRQADERTTSLVNERCPYGREVRGNDSICQMTSTIVGVVAAEAFGYARIEIAESIARGDPGCLVHVHVDPRESGAGQEYFREP